MPSTEFVNSPSFDQTQDVEVPALGVLSRSGGHAEQAVQFGLVPEVVPRERLVDRASDIADILTAQNRHTRRPATRVMSRDWKQRIVADLDMTFDAECYGTFCDSHEHSNMLSINEVLGTLPELQEEYRDA